MTVCVYAIGRAHGARGFHERVGTTRVRAVIVGGLAAYVSEARTPPTPSPASMRRHDRIVRRLHEVLPALVPVRFGTCFASLDDVRVAVDGRSRAVAEALVRVRGRAQMTVRVFSVDHPASAPIHTSDRRESGVSYLRARADEARRVPGFEPVRAAVRRFVKEEAIERGANVTSVYHLVARGQVEPYQRALSAAAAGAGLRMLVTGPHPAYAFV